jgi:hypothetical protein
MGRYYDELLQLVREVLDGTRNLRENVDQLGRSIQGVLGPDSLAELQATVQRRADLASTNARAISSARDDNQRVGTLLVRCTEGVSSLGQEIKGVKSLASDIRLTAINATVTAANCGIEGKAFGVLTGALVEIAHSLQKLAEDCTNHSAKLSGGLSELTSAQAEFESFLSRKDGTASAAQLIETLSALTKQARTTQASLNAPMTALERSAARGSTLGEQLADFLEASETAARALASLHEADSAQLSPSDAAANWGLLEFLEQSGRLNTEVLSKVANEAQRLVGSALPPLAELERSVGAATTLLENFDGLFRQLDNNHAGACTQKESTDLLARYKQAALTLEELTERYLSAMRPTKQAIMQLQSVNNLMKMEIASTRALSTAYSITETIARAIEHFATFETNVDGILARILNAASVCADLLASVAANMRRTKGSAPAPRSFSRHADPRTKATLVGQQSASESIESIARGLIERLQQAQAQAKIPSGGQAFQAMSRWAERQKATLVSRLGQAGFDPEPNETLEHLVDRLRAVARA